MILYMNDRSFKFKFVIHVCGPCQIKLPCLEEAWQLATQPCLINFPFATSKPVQRSSSLR
jgi:hypothetical protein